MRDRNLHVGIKLYEKDNFIHHFDIIFDKICRISDLDEDWLIVYLVDILFMFLNFFCGTNPSFH